MADPTPAPSSETPNLQVLAQYVRDLSFENPRAPAAQQESRPEVDFSVEMNAKGMADDHYELELKLTANASTPVGPVFRIELVYAGIFRLSRIPQEHIEQTLLVECPRYLFPFARRIITELTIDGGFYPPMMLDPIDFAALYAQQKDNLVTQAPPTATGQA